MKDKKNNSQNILSAMKKLEKSFIKKVEDTEFALMVRIEGRVGKTEDVLSGQIKRVEDNLTTKIDGIAKGLDDLRTDNVFGADQIHELRKQAKNHEGRITKLESPQAA